MAVTSRAVAIHDHHTWTGFGSSRFNSREPKHSYSIQYIKIVSKHSVDLNLATAQETVEPAYCFARGRLEKFACAMCFTHITGNDQICGSTVEGYEEISCWLPRFGPLKSHSSKWHRDIVIGNGQHQWLTSLRKHATITAQKFKHHTRILGILVSTEASITFMHLNHVKPPPT
jgi:hypothetical protein